MAEPKIPQRYGLEELLSIGAAFKRNKLWYAPPTDAEGFVNQAVAQLKTYLNVPYVATTSSGTASIHTALGGGLIPAGSEVILPPITDAGTVFPIIFQNAVPVFADVEADTCMLSAETVEPVITDATSAVIVVHLTGCPARMEPLRELCKARKLVLIEDAAQALGARYPDGRFVGTNSDIGCFSTNDQKHITSGEGGFVVVHDEELYYRCHNFADKYYDRHKRGVKLHGVGQNYRMSDVDGAFLLAQLPKLEAIAARRRRLGLLLNERLDTLEGVITQKVPEGAAPSFFFYLFRLEEALTAKVAAVRDALKTAGFTSTAGGYGEKPLYKFKVFQEKSFFPGGVWPAELVAGRKYDYAGLQLPKAELYQNTAVSFQLHQGYREADIERIYETVRAALSSGG